MLSVQLLVAALNTHIFLHFLLQLSANLESREHDNIPELH